MKLEQGETLDPGLFKVAALCRSLSISVDDVIHASLIHHDERIPMTHGIVSVGYEGRTINEFIDQLVAHGVTTVADVRLTPISRKAGFSKTRLSEALNNAGISYLHLRTLGNQKDNREPFHSGRIEEGREVFRATLSSKEAASALNELTEIATNRVVAVLCFEADQQHCHRHVVIDEVTRTEAVPVVQI